MSLRWTSYAASKPPKRGSKMQNGQFSYKSRFLCLKTISSKVVSHSLAYLTVHKWLVGDVPLNVNFVHKVNHPLPRHGAYQHFQKIDAYCGKPFSHLIGYTIAFARSVCDSKASCFWKFGRLSILFGCYPSVLGKCVQKWLDTFTRLSLTTTEYFWWHQQWLL